MERATSHEHHAGRPSLVGIRGSPTTMQDPAYNDKSQSVIIPHSLPRAQLATMPDAEKKVPEWVDTLSWKEEKEMKEKQREQRREERDKREKLNEWLNNIKRVRRSERADVFQGTDVF